MDRNAKEASSANTVGDNYTTLDTAEKSVEEGEHIGFDKLSKEIQDKEGYSKDEADAVAAKIGDRKYGKEEMEKAAHAHHPITEAEVERRAWQLWHTQALGEADLPPAPAAYSNPPAIHQNIDRSGKGDFNPRPDFTDKVPPSTRADVMADRGQWGQSNVQQFRDRANGSRLDRPTPPPPDIPEGFTSSAQLQNWYITGKR